MNGSTKKPKYEIPTMEEIEKLDKNGYKVISTFSGCGGSSLGYKLAGYGAAAGGIAPFASMIHGVAFSLIARQAPFPLV